jgi:hypothetical protein
MNPIGDILHSMLKTAFHLCFCAILLLSPFPAARAQEPQLLPTAATDLVQQVIVRAGSAPSTVSVSFQNISALPPDSQEAVQNAVFTAFRNAGSRLVQPEMAQAKVDITFSQTWHDYLWIANLQQTTGNKLVMKKVARLEQVVAATAPLLTIRKTTVWQQSSPVLDFHLENQTLVILEPEQVSIFNNDSGVWRPRYTLAITHQQAWPRDLRGRLQVSGSQLTAFLPGVRCNGSLSSPSLDCRASDDPWQIDTGTTVAFFSPRRNFFSGILAGSAAGASIVPFFSAAAWQVGDTRQWLFSGTDGRTRLYQQDLSAPAAVFNGWGSGLAAIHSGCGSGSQALVSAPADSTRPDSIQAFEIAGHEAMAVSSGVELSGAIEALWTSGKNGETVNGVTRSPVTGIYEAFTLSVSCGR